MTGDPAPLSHSRFKASEDDQLSELVAEWGTRAWRMIAAAMPGRTARQCRDRWNHYLSSQNWLLPWTPEEDAKLIDMIGKVGLRWTRLASFFPNRTDLSVKRRWLYLFPQKRDELRLSALRRESSARSARSKSIDVPESAMPSNINTDRLFPPELWEDLFDLGNRPGGS
jgi:hypothetical protein